MSSEVGNQNLDEEGKLSPECYQEDALYYDNYQEEDEKGLYKTHEQKLQRLNQLDNQTCCSYKLEEVYPNIGTTTSEKLEEKVKQFRQFKKQVGDVGDSELNKTSNDAKKQEE